MRRRFILKAETGLYIQQGLKNSRFVIRWKNHTKGKEPIYEFFRHVKTMYAAALGIEILCIAAAEIGENTGLYVLASIT
jgi:hypothetical protein